MRNRNSGALALALVALLCGAASARPFIDPRSERAPLFDLDPALAGAPADPACRDRTPVSAGGPFPRDHHTLAIRWLGNTNFELAHDGKIILLDAYYDRGSLYPSLGFKPEDIRRADVILLGHGHFDHMSDGASVGARTHAQIVAAPVTVEKLMTQPVDSKQIRIVTGRGGELLRYQGFTIEPILGRHGEPPASVTEPFDKALKELAPPTPAQLAEQAAIRARGTSDKRVIDEGTIAFLITFADGFRIYYRNSGGHVTDYEKAVMARVGRVDVALVAVAASYLSDLNVEQALEHLHTYRPDVWIPGHHDNPYNLWRATEPLFQALKAENPALVTVSREYREPICFNTEHNVSRTRR
jgi:L-ascorbate metabolism protein UlaG (beta-lactamase superfamily)